MRILVAVGLAAVASIVTARPDAPIDFNYPSSIYGVPSTNNIFDYAPPSPIDHYGPPVDRYGPPIDTYGPPSFDHYQSQLVHKHIYVHVAPPEVEEHHPPQIVHTGTPQKHYKIVFIKAPTPPTPTAPVILPQAQDQQKTLIYVLVKKPEEAPPVILPTAIPTKPSKPEVYFIKYKTQKHTTAVGSKTEAYGPPPPPRPVYGV